MSENLPYNKNSVLRLKSSESPFRASFNIPSLCLSFPHLIHIYYKFPFLKEQQFSFEMQTPYPLLGDCILGDRILGACILGDRTLGACILGDRTFGACINPS